jgi:flavin reductase (DIM6/NTAB) family NADH-FMN oxidoreductase RutF
LTYDYILATREFGVNMSTDTQAGMVWLAGNHSGRDLQKLLDERFAGQTYAAERIKPMMIHGCVLNAECVVFQTFELGEYTAFVGEALVARTNPDAIPLFYTRGKYFRMGEQLPKS